MRWSVLFIVLMFLGMTFVTMDVSGDGGYIPRADVKIHEPGQNAVIAWNGEVERMYLSVNIYAEERTDGFHVVPFPAEPEISLGDNGIFDALTELVEDDYNYRYHSQDSYNYYDSNTGGEKESVTITKTKSLGRHDVTIIRVNDPDGFREEMGPIIRKAGIKLERWPPELNNVIQNYTERGICYFSIDHYPIESDERKLRPIVYEFPSEEVYFPMEISSILDSGTLITLGIVHPEDIDIDLSCFRNSHLYSYINKFLEGEDLNSIDPSLQEFFDGGTVLDLIQFETNLKGITGDVILPPSAFIKEVTREWNFSIYRYDQMNYAIKDTPFTILYEIQNRNRIMCLNMESMDVQWIIQKGPKYEKLRRSFLPVQGSNREYHPIICDELESPSNIQLYRFDPETGEILWEIEKRMDLHDFQTIRDGEGKDHIYVLGWSSFIIVDMETGKIEKDYYWGNYWEMVVQSSGNHIVSTPTGDKFIIMERSQEDISHCFDPFDPDNPREFGRDWEANTSYSHYRTEDVVMSTVFGWIHKAFFMNDILYGVTDGKKGNGSDSYDLWDMYTSEYLGQLNLSDICGIRYLKILEDIDDDGEEELIFLKTYGDPSVISYDLSTRKTEWTVSIPSYEYYDTLVGLVDFGGDGGLDLLLGSEYHSEDDYESLITLINLEKGTISCSGLTCYDPFMNLEEGMVLDAILFGTTEEGLWIFDHIEGNIPISDDPEGRSINKAYFMDLNGNGQKEVIMLMRGNQTNYISHIDPYEAPDDPYKERLLLTYNPVTKYFGAEQDCLLFTLGDAIYWMTGDIDHNRTEPTPLKLDQQDVEINSNIKEYEIEEKIDISETPLREIIFILSMIALFLAVLTFFIKKKQAGKVRPVKIKKVDR